MKIWKPLSGYEGYYEISNDGEVKSLARYIVLRNGKTRYVKEKVLRAKNTGGYLFVALSKNGIRKDYYIHRLVAKAFVVCKHGATYVNHKNGNPSDNSAENLEWVTHAENVQHAYVNGLNNHKGEKHLFSVGVYDREMKQTFSSIKEWAVAQNINYNTARNLLNGYNKTKKLDVSKVYHYSIAS